MSVNVDDNVEVLNLRTEEWKKYKVTNTLSSQFMVRPFGHPDHVESFLFYKDEGVTWRKC